MELHTYELSLILALFNICILKGNIRAEVQIKCLIYILQQGDASYIIWLGVYS